MHKSAHDGRRGGLRDAQEVVQRLIADERAGRIGDVPGDAVLGPGRDDVAVRKRRDARLGTAANDGVVLAHEADVVGLFKINTLTATRSSAIEGRPPA